MKYKKLALTIGVVGFLAGFLIVNQYTKGQSNQMAAVINTISYEQKAPEKETTLYFLGDMMLDRSVRKSVLNNFTNDYDRLFENIGEIKNADILFANLEGPISDKGNNVGSKYSFRMDPKAIKSIENAGFDILSFSNNHVGDWNVNAFLDTISRFENSTIKLVGAGLNKNKIKEPVIIEKNGIKFGYIAFSDVGPDWLKATDNKPGILIAKDEQFESIIKKAKEKVDILIISFHWGEEYKKIHNVRQEILAHLSIDSGADIIIGHHPHVIEDIENYKGKPIAYSLGNFIFDQYFSEDTMEGMLLKIVFKGKEINKIENKLITLNKKYQPEGIFKDRDEAKSKRVCGKPNKKYDDYSLINVGQNIPIPEKEYIPNDLSLLDKDISTTQICLKEEAANQVKNMINNALVDKLKIKVSSGFRSYKTQKLILDTNIKNGNKDASKLIAKPGYSEHQLGVAVDLTGSSINNASATKRFENTKEAIWLENNAYKYGFIQSYPKNKYDITGYLPEAWHYRYVGVENAKKIKDEGITITEFLSKR